MIVWRGMGFLALIVAMIFNVFIQVACQSSRYVLDSCQMVVRYLRRSGSVDRLYEMGCC